LLDLSHGTANLNIHSLSLGGRRHRLAGRALVAIVYGRFRDWTCARFSESLPQPRLRWPRSRDVVRLRDRGIERRVQAEAPQAALFSQDHGTVQFDSETLSFAGEPVEQAMCLMRGMDATRNLGPPLERLPAPLASRIGETTGCRRAKR